MYITVSIGNTDNRLTQKEWHEFVKEMGVLLKDKGNIHFFGGSPNYEWWQNAAWIVEINNLEFLTADIFRLREKYKQDSAFLLFGEGIFV